MARFDRTADREDRPQRQRPATSRSLGGMEEGGGGGGGRPNRNDGGNWRNRPTVTVTPEMSRRLGLRPGVYVRDGSEAFPIEEVEAANGNFSDIDPSTGIKSQTGGRTVWTGLRNAAQVDQTARYREGAWGSDFRQQRRQVEQDPRFARMNETERDYLRNAGPGEWQQFMSGTGDYAPALGYEAPAAAAPPVTPPVPGPPQPAPDLPQPGTSLTIGSLGGPSRATPATPQPVGATGTPDPGTRPPTAGPSGVSGVAGSLGQPGRPIVDPAQGRMRPMSQRAPMSMSKPWTQQRLRPVGY